MSKSEHKKTNAGKSKTSAGILVFRQRAGGTEVLLGHPGGPFWKNKDAGSWTIPKGEPQTGEDLADAARREFFEETGWNPGNRDQYQLVPVRQKAGKWIHAWITRADKTESELQSNFFSMEWPPGSGRSQNFPEIDRFGWMNLGEARDKINPAQIAFLDELEKKLQEG